MRSSMRWRSLGLRVSSEMLWTFAVAAMARSTARVPGCPPRVDTAAASRPRSRATAASSRSGSNVASMTPRRSAAGALVVVAGDHEAEVQVDEAGGAASAFELAWVLGADQHRRVQERPHLGERVGDLAQEALEVVYGASPCAGVSRTSVRVVARTRRARAC